MNIKRYFTTKNVTLTVGILFIFFTAFYYAQKEYNWFSPTGTKTDTKTESELTTLLPTSNNVDGNSVLLTNLTDTSATVIWLTNKEEVGYVNYWKAESDNPQIEKSVDQRINLNNTVNRYKSHSIRLEYLKPETTYHFEVYSTDSLIFTGNFTTYQIESSPPQLKLISGELKSQSNNAIIVFQISEKDSIKSNLISTLVDSKGKWYTSLGSFRNPKTGQYYEITDNTLVNIVSYTNDGTSGYSLPYANAFDTEIKLTNFKNE